MGLQDIPEMIRIRYKPNIFPSGLSHSWHELSHGETSETGNKGHNIEAHEVLVEVSLF